MNIIVTGAGAGIGFEISKYYTNQLGHKVVAISRNRDNLKKLLNVCQGDLLHICPMDITGFPINIDFMDFFGSDKQVLDILVNNAGTLLNKPFTEISREELNRVYEVNVFGPFRFIQLLFPYLYRSGNAHIVNIGSMGGFQGSVKFPGLSAYSSSKAALAGLTECLAEEFAGTNIKINCLALGAVQTEMLSKAFPEYKAPVKPEEMGEFIARFGIEGMKFFNGKVLPVSTGTP